MKEIPCLEEIFTYFDIIHNTSQGSIDKKIKLNYQPNKHHEFSISVYKSIYVVDKKEHFFSIDLYHTMDDICIIDQISAVYILFDIKKSRYYAKTPFSDIPTKYRNKKYFFYMDYEEMKWDDLLKEIQLETIKHM